MGEPIERARRSSLEHGLLDEAGGDLVLPLQSGEDVLELRDLLLELGVLLGEGTAGRHGVDVPDLPLLWVGSC